MNEPEHNNSTRFAPLKAREAVKECRAHLTDVQANGNVYSNDTKTVIMKWGKAEPLARAGSAEVRLSHDNPASLEVWSLETNGARRERIPCRVEDGKLVFTVAIAAPSAIFNYEVVVR